ncbi:hypothetical protein Taro_040060 [Colocasia esculenta]|uniref:Uncharacterized protein n=1 Tax=Colocasia esculenta TaxID=4460 RepID=A0A843WTC5_COLES|nr:hypothetical protein [Colocasia esculenta]
MRKARRVPAEATPPLPTLPPPYQMGGEDPRAWFKLQNLMQDYEELLKDAAAKRKRLQIARQKVGNLTDEVKFLRRRRKYLTKNASPTPYKVRTHLQKAPNAPKRRGGKSLAALNAIPQSQELGGQFSQHDSSYREKEVALPSTAVTLDLNQMSMPDEEEAGFQVAWNPLPMDSSSRYMPQGEAPGADLKFSGLRDARSGSNRAGKRKVSWQDQVALKV